MPTTRRPKYPHLPLLPRKYAAVKDSDKPCDRTRVAAHQTQDQDSGKSSADQKPWYVYIVRCNDGTLYTGITTDTDRRIEEHNHSSRGASYTRGRRPVQIVYRQTEYDRSAASQHEWKIKQLSRRRKESLIIETEFT